jgi:hypothetical protein
LREEDHNKDLSSTEYEKMEEKLLKLGADVRRVTD